MRNFFPNQITRGLTGKWILVFYSLMVLFTGTIACSQATAAVAKIDESRSGVTMGHLTDAMIVTISEIGSGIISQPLHTKELIGISPVAIGHEQRRSVVSQPLASRVINAYNPVNLPILFGNRSTYYLTVAECHEEIENIRERSLDTEHHERFVECRCCDSNTDGLELLEWRECLQADKAIGNLGLTEKIERYERLEDDCI